MQHEMSRRGAIELSMTTMIVIILGITLLGLMLVWISDLGEKLTSKTDDIFEELDKQIEDQMRPGQDFLVLGQSFKTPVDEPLSIGVGVRNKAGVKGNVGVTIVADPGNPEASSWIYKVPSPIEIEPNDVQGFQIIIKVPKTVQSGEIAIFLIKGDTGFGIKTEPITVEVE